MERAIDRGKVKEKAIEIKAVILTRDKDFLDQVNFRICTHPGVLLLKFPYSQLAQDRIRTFLAVHHKQCRHSAVQLFESFAYVQDKAAGPQRAVQY